MNNLHKIAQKNVDIPSYVKSWMHQFINTHTYYYNRATKEYFVKSPGYKKRYMKMDQDFLYIIKVQVRPNSAYENPNVFPPNLIIE